MEDNRLSQQFIHDVREIVSKARQQAYSAINSAMVEAYWKMGKRIVQGPTTGSNC